MKQSFLARVPVLYVRSSYKRCASLTTSTQVGIFDSSRKGWDVYKAICIDIPRTILKPASEYIADWVWAEVTGDDDDGPGWAQWAELTRR